MAHLTDMEELLAIIQTTSVRDYMQEALQCYMAGAYRGAIVLSHIALFDDLLAKLGELASVNSVAKIIFEEATKKKNDQDVFESYLIDQLGSKNLLTGLDTAFLSTLRDLRNKSAHPSGHKPSPEEARFIFFETITRFLSRESLSTTHLVDELIARLANANFFPTLIIDDIKTVVADEITPLHHLALPQLVSKLVPKIKSTDDNTQKNAGHFLLGMAALGHPESISSLQSKLLSAKADDPDYATLLTQVLSSNGRLILGLPQLAVARIRANLAKQIEELGTAMSETKLAHPTSALMSIASAMDEETLLSVFKPELEKLIDKRTHSPFILKLVAARLSLFPYYFSMLLQKAGSSDYSLANTFANAAESLDAGLASILDDEQAFQVIVAIKSAADWNAWSAKGLVSSKFVGMPNLRSKALRYVETANAEATEYIATKLSSARTADEFVASNLVDE